MEDSYIIQGGKVLKGEVVVSGSKNSSMKLLIASLFLDSPVMLENIPYIKDVEEVVHIMKDLGVKVEDLGDHSFRIDASGIKKNKIDLLHGSKVRVSFMFLAPLIYRFSECYIPNPGGCRIGARPIDRIIKGVQALGIDSVYNSQTGYYHLRKKKEIGGYYKFEKPTHTGTETLIMLGAFAEKDVILDNCALEPEIDELIEFFRKAGVDLYREESNPSRIVIKKSRLKKEISSPFRVKGDRNEAVSYASLGLSLAEKLVVKGVEIEKYKVFLDKVKEAGGYFEILDESTVLFKRSDLKAVSIETAPHPGFMTDWQPFWANLMIMVKGKSYITEWVFENRFGYVPELRKLGADIDFVQTPKEDYDKFLFTPDPEKKYFQTIRITGVDDLHNGVLSVTDLRAGACLIFAALRARGESIVQGAHIVARGYENLEQRLRSLGADIKLV